MQERGSDGPIPPGLKRGVREYVINDELAMAARTVIGTLDPNTPVASLVLWNERSIQAEKSAIRFNLEYRIRHKVPGASQAEIKYSIACLDCVPKAPETWVEFLEGLEPNRRKALLDNMRQAIMPPKGTAHDFSLKISEVEQLIAAKAKLSRRDRFTQIMFAGLASEDQP